MIGEVETLETRNSDELDFYDTAIWQLVEIAEKAYNVGFKAGMKASKKK